jgi:hypothetical protein
MMMESLTSLCNERDCAVEVERIMFADPIEHLFEELIDLFLGGVLCGLFEVGKPLMELSVGLGPK